MRFERIDAAIVVTIDQSSLAIESFHKQLMFSNASHAQLRSRQNSRSSRISLKSNQEMINQSDMMSSISILTR
jgi:hypothetical protein